MIYRYMVVTNYVILKYMLLFKVHIKISLKLEKSTVCFIICAQPFQAISYVLQFQL